MTMSPVDLQRKVRQLDNDMSSTYELIFAIQNTLRRHGNRMAELTEMVAAHDARFDAVDSKLDGHDARFEAVETKLDTVETKLDTVETKLDTVLDVVRGLGQRDT